MTARSWYLVVLLAEQNEPFLKFLLDWWSVVPHDCTIVYILDFWCAGKPSNLTILRIVFVLSWQYYTTSHIVR